MKLKDKIKVFEDEMGLDQKGLADFLGLNHMVFNRNISKERMTSDMIYAFAEKLPHVDLNKLIKKEESLLILEEEKEVYQKEPVILISKAIEILENLKKEIARK